MAQTDRGSASRSDPRSSPYEKAILGFCSVWSLRGHCGARTPSVTGVGGLLVAISGISVVTFSPTA